MNFPIRCEGCDVVLTEEGIDLCSFCADHLEKALDEPDLHLDCRDIDFAEFQVRANDVLAAFSQVEDVALSNASLRGSWSRPAGVPAPAPHFVLSVCVRTERCGYDCLETAYPTDEQMLAARALASEFGTTVAFEDVEKGWGDLTFTLVSPARIPT
jgi:hypothetical protein